MKKCSQLHESFFMKYLFWNRIQEIMKVFCYKTLDLYGIHSYSCASVIVALAVEVVLPTWQLMESIVFSLVLVTVTLD